MARSTDSGTQASAARVRIEFEIESKNFAAHGHNPADCDLIVWQRHNRPEASLPVLELRTAIKGLDP
jgi:hypothetical protein